MTLKMHSDMAMFAKPENVDGRSAEMLVVDICSEVVAMRPLYVRWDFDRNDWIVEKPEMDEMGCIKTVDGKPVVREMK